VSTTPDPDSVAVANEARQSADTPASEQGPVIPDRARDDSDLGWGEDPGRDGHDRDDAWYQRERPPHWE
jgi:hypothetical protein